MEIDFYLKEGEENVVEVEETEKVFDSIEKMTLAAYMGATVSLISFF